MSTVTGCFISLILTVVHLSNVHDCSLVSLELLKKLWFQLVFRIIYSKNGKYFQRTSSGCVEV